MACMKRAKSLAKAIVAGAATSVGLYTGLWTASELYASTLPREESDRLAILISQPIAFYDWPRYLPGATDIYVHRVEQAFGQRAVVYDPATREDLEAVLLDDSIQNIVIAGHGSWDSWQLAPHTKENRRTKTDIVKVKDLALPEGAKKKSGLFVRHTCGVYRDLSFYTPVERDIVDDYIGRLDKASNGKVRAFTPYNERDMRLLLEEGQSLGPAETTAVDSVMKQYFDVLAARDIKWYSYEYQLGEGIMETNEQVRGWDYVTTPVLFLFEPIPGHLDVAQELEGYKTYSRANTLAAKHYTIDKENDGDPPGGPDHFYEGKNYITVFHDGANLQEPPIGLVKDTAVADDLFLLNYVGTTECIPSRLDDIAWRRRQYENGSKAEEALVWAACDAEYAAIDECHQLTELPPTVWRARVANYERDSWVSQDVLRKLEESITDQCLPEIETNRWIRDGTCIIAPEPMSTDKEVRLSKRPQERRKKNNF